MSKLMDALDRVRRELMSMEQSIQRGVPPHELSDQIKRAKFDVESALANNSNDVYGHERQGSGKI